MTNNSCVELHNVDYLGGNKYKGTIPLLMLYLWLKRPFINYCPATQRGEYNPNDPDAITNFDFNTLLPITYPLLVLDNQKVNEMAILYLRGQLYWSDLIWNARLDLDYPCSLEYDSEKRVLKIYTTITIPDSAHRHRAYFRIFEWKNQPESIPAYIEIKETFEKISRNEIQKLLIEFDPQKTESVTVHNLPPSEEGTLFRQLNMLTKKATSSQIIRVNPEMSPSTRFISQIINKCTIFDRKEIEENRTSIHNKSRKLVPNSTINSAIKPYSKFLLNLENKSPFALNDLLECINDFFNRLAEYYPEMKNGASREVRERSRKQESYIIENVMFIILFRIAIEVWKMFHQNSKPWKNDPQFIQIINSLNKDVIIEDDKTTNIMSRANVHWIGIIVNNQGKISNNRPSQSAALSYLANEIGLSTIKVEV